MGARRGGGPKGWGPEGVGAQNFALFSISHNNFLSFFPLLGVLSSFFSLSGGSSRGILVVFWSAEAKFWAVLRRGSRAGGPGQGVWSRGVGTPHTTNPSLHHNQAAPRTSHKLFFPNKEPSVATWHLKPSTCILQLWCFSDSHIFIL